MIFLSVNLLIRVMLLAALPLCSHALYLLGLPLPRLFYSRKERGLPHAHIVLQLEEAKVFILQKFEELTAKYNALTNKADIPVPTVDDAAAFWVDIHISAELPIDPREPEFRERYAPLYELSAQYKDDLTFFQGILNMHVHKHPGNHLVNGCLDKHGICKSGYSNRTTRPHTSFSGQGFPQYRRRSTVDLDIVPHNRELFMDWGCGHANVEFSGLAYTVLYLYKYLFKGPTKITLTMNEQGQDPTRREVMDLHKNDEVGRYIRGRRLCSMDAMWRLLAFQTYPASDPPVVGIKVRLPGFLQDYTQKKLLCDLHVYFARPGQLHLLTFEEMFTRYIVYRKEPSIAWKNKHRDVDNSHFLLHTLTGIYGVNPVYIQLRDPTKPVFCRLHTVAYSSGELWFERLLLKLYAFRTLADLYSYDDIIYDTFQQACIARGCANDILECLACFEDSVLDGDRSPRELRSLFVALSINGFPVHVIYDNLVLRETMFEGDWVNRHQPENTANAIQRLLSDLSERVAEHGKTMTDLGMPEPENEATEMERFLLRFPILEQASLYSHLSRTKALNDEQQVVFEAIKTAILRQSKTGRGTFITLEGSGGTGKTEVAKHLMAHIRSLPIAGSRFARSVHCVCSTALGAQNYPKGECSTAHSFFVLPVEQDYDKELHDDEPMLCNATTKPQRFALIEAADVIFWDEAMANHRECLEAVLNAFDDFKGSICTLLLFLSFFIPLLILSGQLLPLTLHYSPPSLIPICNPLSRKGLDSYARR